MKRLICMLLVAALLVGNCTVMADTTVKAQSSTKSEDAGIYVEKIDGLSDDFIMGVDVSSLLSVEESGVKFYDWDGITEQDVFVTMAQSGVNWVRFRIWNDPYTKEGNGYGGGNVDLEKAIIMAKRAQDAGMKILLNFQYSDFWAHPGVQTIPKAWADFSVEERAQAIYDYTIESLNKVKAAGIHSVGMVQVGNETTTRFCGASDWTEMAKMFNAGCKAVKDFDPTIKTAIHFTNPERTSVIKQLADELNKQKIEYDVFGTSYYPFWHGGLDNLQEVLNYVADSYGKEVMVAEVSWTWIIGDGDGHANNIGSEELVAQYGASVQAQATVLREVMNVVSNVNKGKGIGTFYWEPAWLPATDDSKTGGLSRVEKWNKFGSGWASVYATEYPGYEERDGVSEYWGGSSWDNHSLFDWNGVPMESLKTYRYVYTGTNTHPTVSKVESPTIMCEAGGKYALPSKVEVEYEGVLGVSHAVDVTWDTSDLEKVNVNTPGEYVVQGTLADTDSVKVACTVKVYVDTIVSLNDITETVKVNEAVTYPSTVEATYYSGKRKQVPISWNQEEINKLSTKRIGKYLVSGTVDTWDKPVYMQLQVEGENLVKNPGFEDTDNVWGQVRKVPNWTLSSNAGTASTRPIYVSTHGNAFDGYGKLEVWTDQFDGFEVEAYQEIDIANTGDGEYTASFSTNGNLENAVAYIKSGTHDGTILQEVKLPKTEDWTNVTFKVDVDNTDTITIGFKGANIKKNDWLRIDQVAVSLTDEQEKINTLQQLVDVAQRISKDMCDAVDSSYATFDTAKAAAKKLVANAEATDTDIKEAYDVLNKAINNLKFKVEILSTVNGKVATSVQYAKRGQMVSIIAEPDVAYCLKDLAVKTDALSMVSKEDTFIMPASSVEVQARFEQVNLDDVEVTFHYYYEGNTKPAVVFASNKAGDVDFTMAGRAGYFMEKDPSNEHWYTFKVKGGYGTFQLYEITAQQLAAGTATGNLIDSFGAEGSGQERYDDLFRGKSYYREGELFQTADEKKEVLVSEIKLPTTSKTVTVGDIFSIPAVEVVPSNAANKTVVYSSDNLKVATVNEATGVVTTVGVGTTIIKVSSMDGSNVSTAFSLTVKAVPVIKMTSIVLKDTKKSLTVGDTDQITVKSMSPTNATNKAVSYSSNNTSVVTVGATGMITAKAAGTAVVTVKAQDGSNVSAKVTITVKRKTLSAQRVAVQSGSANEITVTWNKTSNVAAYDVYVDGKKVGRTTKTAYSYKKASAGKTYKVQIVAVPKDTKMYQESAKSSPVTIQCLISTKTVKATSTKKKNVTVTWNKISGATGYQVVRSTKQSTGFSQVRLVNSKTMKWNDSSVKSGKTYYYKVRAYKDYNGKKVYGEYSKVVKVKAK